MNPTQTPTARRRAPRPVRAVALWLTVFAALFVLNIGVPWLVGTAWPVLLILAIPLTWAGIRAMGAHR